ncbi:MAG TPA: ABC transporter substrate-binding protein [Acidimicrobiales bacterium]|nr:ABC transporter substrate-binding protein [Acidimicrobiales bacterium]
MQVRRRIRFVTIAVLVGLLAAACGDDGGDDASGTATTAGGSGATAPATTAAPKTGGSVTMGVFAEPSGLDPVVAQGGGTGGNHEMGAIYDTLMRIDPTTKAFVPQLAESIAANADGSEFTLKLRPNVKFSDGTDFDAEAVVFGLKRHVQYGSAFAGQVSSVKEYTVVDKLTVKMTLTGPWPNFPYVLSNAPGMIPSPTAIKAQCADLTKPARECSFAQKPVGAGPFVVDSYKPREALDLKRSPTYWGGPAYLDSLKFVLLRGAQATYDGLKTNTLQVGFLREAQAIKTAADEKQFDSYTLIQGFGGIVLLNNGQITCKGGLPAAVCAGKPDGIIDLGKPTGDKRIRQAIAHAIDPTQMDQRMNQGTGLPGFEFFVKGSRFDVGPMAETNVDKAKALVEEVKKEKNWDGSISVACLAEQATGPAFVLAVATALNAVGFKATQDVKPATEYITNVQTSRNYDVACWGFNVADEAPEAGLSRHVLSVAGGNSGGNAMNLNNTAIDTQIKALREAKTDPERKSAFEKILTVWKEEIPSVVYSNNAEVIAFNKKVKDLKFNVATTVMFDKAWLDS